MGRGGGGGAAAVAVPEIGDDDALLGDPHVAGQVAKHFHDIDDVPFRRDHRYQQADRNLPRNLQQSAKLCLQQVGILTQHADTSPAKKWVRLYR